MGCKLHSLTSSVRRRILRTEERESAIARKSLSSYILLVHICQILFARVAIRKLKSLENEKSLSCLEDKRPPRQQTVASEIDALNDDVWLTLAAQLPQRRRPTHQFALGTRIIQFPFA